MKVLAVVKGRSVLEVEQLLERDPSIDCIGENRWPDCDANFKHFQDLERHFIGPLQKNKVRKVVPICEVIQSVDSWELLQRIDMVAAEFGKVMKFCLQVNVAEDSAKSGIEADEVDAFVRKYVEANLQNVKMVGLMTIGSRTGQKEYFTKMRGIFDSVNAILPIEILSMGMSDDYQLAEECGATMVRLGRKLFQGILDTFTDVCDKRIY
ncbi:YggS family pyridoxal phosphate-dependent enzyme, partial [Candidatus Gracilibacteria bacterium]|nr:YggS family pyridoxal phosphate-dependent enzyme [Candidatus Gracilibacteria bacterium]